MSQADLISMNSAETDPLLATLNPASVAVLGASDNPDKVGGRPIHYMRKHGYRGRVYPINPGREQVQGLRSYPDLAALPEVPELAVIVVSGEAAISAVEQCARLGVRAAIVIASGFGEVDAAGARAQQRMVALARAAGMRLVGPNSQGFADFSTGAITSFSTMFIEYPPQDGPVSIVSQSGALSAAVYGMLRARGIGVRHVLATGNEADVCVPDVARRVVADPGVGLVVLYMEHIADPAGLAEAAALARARSLPIVALKTGRTRSGQAMAASHTGSLANEDRIVDAFLAAHGILRVGGIGELVRVAPLLLAKARPAGRRLIAISNSGASCVMSADAAESAGLQLAQVSPTTAAALQAVLPSFSTSRNPIDLTGALLSDSALFGRVLAVLADNAQTDLVHIDIPVAGQGYDLAGFASATAEFARRTGKPLTVSCWQPTVAAPFAAQGLPVYETIEDAMQALADLVRHADLMAAPPPVSEPGRGAAAGILDGLDLSALPPPGPTDIDRSWPSPGAADTNRSSPSPGAAGSNRSSSPLPRFLSEADSLGLLRDAGLPVTPFVLCAADDPLPAARAALADFGGPVVFKACSASLPHKSEHGLVALGLDDDQALARVAASQRATLTRLGVQVDGFLVAPMRAGRHELLLGARLDPAFGPVVIVGDGGRYVEAMPDTALLPWPFDAQRVLSALRGLRIWPVLAGTRGEPALDVGAFADAAVRLGALAGALGARLASLEANPVMIGAVGEGVWIVDALVEPAGSPDP
ncbi:MAG: acetate--CoA ligase family protein [Burkholderiaceae bacterium]